LKERPYQKLIEKNKKIIVFLFFLVLLLTGLNIYKDYGVHWDEYTNQHFGYKWAGYANNVIFRKGVAGDSSPDSQDLTHGPVFEIFVLFIQRKFFSINDSRHLIFFRHLCTFLLFYTGVYFFYLICKLHFKNWKICLLGSVFFILSPRIFAESFYNSNDIPFLSFYIICMYTLLRYLDKKTFTSAAIHAVTCALLIDIRIAGVTLPLYTLAFLAADILRMSTHREKVRGSKTALLYISLLIVLSFIFWPLLWSHTFSKLAMMVKALKNDYWTGSYLYFGRYAKLENQPWHYGPVWILISTPLFYSFCFFVGCLASIKMYIKNSIMPACTKRNNLLFALWFLFPLILSYRRMYDGWRHLYFIYPAFLIFSLTGLIALWKFIEIRFQKQISRIIHAALIIAAVLSMTNSVYFMVKNHPYQNVYFNILAGRNMKAIKSRFELDYWGLSYRKALEYILRNDKDDVIKIYVANAPGRHNANILTEDCKKRLLYVTSLDDAKYFLSNYRFHPGEYPYKEEFFSIKIGEAKIMIVYKLK